MSKRCKPETCYGKTYNSHKELTRDFGIDDARYNQYCALRNAGMTPENAIEITVDGHHNKAIALLKKGFTVETVVNYFKNGEKVTESIKVLTVDSEPKNDGNEELAVEDKDELVFETEDDDEDVVVPDEFDKISSPIHYDVKTPMQLIEELRKLKFSRINLIDFENISGKMDLSDYINEENTINIFFFNACKYATEFIVAIRGTRNINLKVLTYRCGYNLIDHMITYYLGAIYSEFPDKEYCIISMDRGFYSFVTSLGHENEMVYGTKVLKNPRDRYKYSLYKYLLNDNILKNRKCVIRRDLFAIFDNFCKNKKLDDAEINRMVKDLSEKFKVMKVIHKKGLDYYEFDMDKIRKFVLE